MLKFVLKAFEQAPDVIASAASAVELDLAAARRQDHNAWSDVAINDQ